MSFSDGTLLGGRVVYRQPLTGHRSGIEPVLLAASVPARPNERILEGGSGAGAGLLCLARRVPGVVGIGVEIAPEPRVCAEHNALTNGFDALRFIGGNLTDARLDLGVSGNFHHAMANPPWHPAGTASADGARELARRAPESVFASWTKGLANRLLHHGSLTVISPAAALPDLLAAITGAGCGSPQIFPLWPKPDRSAKLLLVRAIKGGRGPARVLAGLVLHTQDGKFTVAAEAVLRDGEAIPWLGTD